MPIMDSKEERQRNCWQALRLSKYLVIAIVFVSMMLDLMMITSIEPILPDMLYTLDAKNNFTILQGHDSGQQKNTTSNASIYSSKATEIGIVLAIKPATEMFANIFVGCIVDRFGHKYPLILGCIANFVATIGFAYGGSFYMLLVIRVVQAIGSSLSVVAGLALLACVFTDDRERVKATNIAFAGLSIGIILGFPFGSTFYEFLGRKAPFIMLAGLIFLDGALRFVVKVPTQKNKPVKATVSDFKALLMDPYIVIALGCSSIINVGLGVVCTTSPAWMLDKLKCQQWQIGVVLVVASVFQCGAQYLTGVYSVTFGRWKFCVIGLQLYGVGLVVYPLCTIIWEVIGPEALARIGLGVTLGVISPLLAYLVDVRHSSNYGAIYGLYASSYNMGLVVGPVCGGTLMHYVGFDWLYRGTGILMVLYSFICIFFKRLEIPTELPINKDNKPDVNVNYGTITT